MADFCGTGSDVRAARGNAWRGNGGACGHHGGMRLNVDVTVAGCLSVGNSRQPPAARRFDVVLYSRHDRALCVSSDSWPLSIGTLRAENTGVYLETPSGILPLQGQFVSVYCPGGAAKYGSNPVQRCPVSSPTVRSATPIASLRMPAGDFTTPWRHPRPAVDPCARASEPLPPAR